MVMRAHHNIPRDGRRCTLDDTAKSAIQNMNGCYGGFYRQPQDFRACHRMISAGYRTIIA